MAQIELRIWCDSDGNTRVEADDCEAFDNLDQGLAIREIHLTIDIVEPKASTGRVSVPEEDQGEIKVTLDK